MTNIIINFIALYPPTIHPRKEKKKTLLLLAHPNTYFTAFSTPVN